MKQLLFILTIIASVIFISCDDDNETQNKPLFNEDLSGIAEDPIIVGRWIIANKEEEKQSSVTLNVSGGFSSILPMRLVSINKGLEGMTINHQVYVPSNETHKKNSMLVVSKDCKVRLHTKFSCTHTSNDMVAITLLKNGSSVAKSIFSIKGSINIDSTVDMPLKKGDILFFIISRGLLSSSISIPVTITNSDIYIEEIE